MSGRCHDAPDSGSGTQGACGGRSETLSSLQAAASSVGSAARSCSPPKSTALMPCENQMPGLCAVAVEPTRPSHRHRRTTLKSAHNHQSVKRCGRRDQQMPKCVHTRANSGAPRCCPSGWRCARPGLLPGARPAARHHCSRNLLPLLSPAARCLPAVLPQTRLQSGTPADRKESLCSECRDSSPGLKWARLDSGSGMNPVSQTQAVPVATPVMHPATPGWPPNALRALRPLPAPAPPATSPPRERLQLDNTHVKKRTWPETHPDMLKGVWPPCARRIHPGNVNTDGMAASYRSPDIGETASANRPPDLTTDCRLVRLPFCGSVEAGVAGLRFLLLPVFS